MVAVHVAAAAGAAGEEARGGGGGSGSGGGATRARLEDLNIFYSINPPTRHSQATSINIIYRILRAISPPAACNRLSICTIGYSTC
eukprot:scaffold58659_cov55-Phaeocystis_antarctica.AAC.2